MARSFLRGGTWGKLFSAVDGCFILSPTAHFSSCWEKWAVGDTFSMQKCYWKKVTPRRQNKNHPPKPRKDPQKNRRVILTRLFLTSSLS